MARNGTWNADLRTHVYLDPNMGTDEPRVASVEAKAKNGAWCATANIPFATRLLQMSGKHAKRAETPQTDHMEKVPKTSQD